MVFTAEKSSKIDVMSDADKARLESIAPLFDIEFRVLDSFRCEIVVRDGPATRVVEVAIQRAYTRLLTEICSKTINWVYFRGAEHCGKTLLGLPDTKIKRIAQLYRLREKPQPPKNSNCPQKGLAGEEKRRPERGGVVKSMRSET